MWADERVLRTDKKDAMTLKETDSNEESPAGERPIHIEHLSDTNLLLFPGIAETRYATATCAGDMRQTNPSLTGPTSPPK